MYYKGTIGGYYKSLTDFQLKGSLVSKCNSRQILGARDGKGSGITFCKIVIWKLKGIISTYIIMAKFIHTVLSCKESLSRDLLVGKMCTKVAVSATKINEENRRRLRIRNIIENYSVSLMFILFFF